ncbi:peptide-methionine (S)-S-oxide reductase [Dyadobacter luticola]|uniref:peptide-methionine (S)-S-oxide reductase n=1 Tax=Dyadobacter luticola TaxID=1979387 RepID=A0A5R9KTJ3_9BACT|nr:peptide-methionine (S)-S-oxide reductase [Dyadobacter luticola]TLU99523.1 peptide methionine sulfoxide reductase [Dyadobacter luticola]
MSSTNKIGLGGSCHWCTEAIFQSLKGVLHVSQGWIAADDNPTRYSEAVVFEFDAAEISLQTLIEIHLHTHSCTSDHSMRFKYRSAIYTFDDKQFCCANQAIKELQADFDQRIITEVIPFGKFKLNNEKYLDYYSKNPYKPFCKTFIDPKLKILLGKFSNQVDKKRLNSSV